MSAQATADDPADGEATWPQAADLELLGLQVDPDDPCRSRFVIEPHLCRRDGDLYGGAALGVALSSFEAVAERPALWATVQFVGVASMGETIECRVEPVARGRAVHQLQVTGTVGDRHIFSALGAAAAPRFNGISGGARVMPVVEPPDDAPSLGFDSEGAAHTVGHYLRSEFREVEMANPTSPGHYTMWARIFGQDRTTAAGLGFLADMVPIAVCRGAGIEGAGTSLDNSLRVGQLVDTEWVLVELEAHVAAGGYGYGVSHLWSPDGTLMATGSQTAKLFSFASFLERQTQAPTELPAD
jgi:acyl-CoA thioesterase